MESLLIKPDITKKYFTVYEALEDLGFKKIAPHDLPNWTFDFIPDDYENRVVEKDDKYFIFVSMDHFNSKIYGIQLNPIKGE